MAQNKWGKGGPVDKGKNEKITDLIRKIVEKILGYVLPAFHITLRLPSSFPTHCCAKEMAKISMKDER